VVNTGLRKALLGRVNENQSVIRVVTAQTSNHGLRVLLITSHVNESEDLGGGLNYLGPGEQTKLVPVCDDFTLAVKAQDLL
jgi:hypothetical protein